MYVAVKGGEAAIDNAHRLLADRRRGNRDVADLGLDQIMEQLSLAVDRVMSEGALYDRELAALAIKQARGDLIEAIFLARASRALAYLEGRDFVLPDDVKSVAYPVLRHRLRTTYEADAKGIDADQLIDRLLATVPSP